MALVLKRIFRLYHHVIYDLADERLDGYFLMSSPLPVMGILGLYLYFIYDFGPKFMKDRPPYNLDRVITVFNVLQIVTNSYIFLQGAIHLHRLDIRCQPVDYSRSEFALLQVNMTYLYFITKLADLLDTVFFVLRKKFNQVSFLHVYHHVGMTALAYIGTKYIPGGHGCYLGILNSFVHAVMYTYYFVAGLGPEYKKYLWWKKYITQIQILQFFLILLIYGQLLFRPGCGYPMVASCFLVPQNLFMLLLFSQFYYKTYVKPEKSE